MTGHCFNKGSSLQASVTEVGRRVGLSFKFEIHIRNSMSKTAKFGKLFKMTIPS